VGSCGKWGEVGLESERDHSALEAFPGAFGVRFVVMIDAEFVVGDSVVEHVPDDDEQRVLECDYGTQGTGMGLNATVFHGEVGRF
jgi:hypothetical protein